MLEEWGLLILHLDRGLGFSFNFTIRIVGLKVATWWTWTLVGSLCFYDDFSYS